MQTTKRAISLCPARVRGFTYIEMAVVIAIIAILMLIVLQIGRSVADAGRSRQTQATLAVLDNALTAYAAERPGQFPSEFTDSRGVAYPLIDGRCIEDVGTDVSSYTAPAYPSLALFFAAGRRNEAIEAAVRGIDPSRVVPVNMAQYSTRFTQPQERVSANVPETPITMFTVLDGWDRPIRFVHPAFDGGYGNGYRPSSVGATNFTSVARPSLKLTLATANGGTQETNFRRAAMPFDPARPDYVTTWTGDADEGTSAGARAYFYSAGRDGNPGTRGDNIYSIRPNFAAETGTSAQ